LKQIILGTAGHIDHGKTSLIKAVTGINTDRLKEEKLRGITIELGFASMDLPSGRHIGIVDVPGHEKFVKHMVAGATGIDIVVLVIAADEGVMPQTREHMDICSLLNIKYGFVALTKTDMVDEEWLELVTEDIMDFVHGTFLENAPVVPVSSTTGKGLPEFIETLNELSSKIPQKTATGLFRLPVDRVFTMKGFGTVITGTLLSGKVSVGDSIMIYPSGITSKVRGIQVHNQSVDTAFAGMRTAINFQGLEKASISRGEVLSSPEALTPSYMVDLSVRFLPGNSKPLKNRSRVRFHTGTSEIPGVLVLLDRDKLMPGDSAAAQIRLDSPVAVVKDDSFVLRSYSPVRTIAGGQVLNPIPNKHKSFKPETIQGLKVIAENTPEEVAAYHIDEAGLKGVSFSSLKIMTNIPEKKLLNVMQSLLSKKRVVITDRENLTYIHEKTLKNLNNDISGYLENFHKIHPLKTGMSKEELKSKLPAAVGQKLFSLIINQMIKEGKITAEQSIIRLAKHSVSLRIDQEDLKQKITAAYKKAGLSPPYFKELSNTLKIEPKYGKDVLLLLVNKKILIKAKEDLYFYADAVNALKEKLVNFLETNKELTTPQFKEMTSVSRKYLIPLIEYFDSAKVTIRIGDIRRLR